LSIELITILMFVTLIALMATGLPIAFCLGATGIIFAFFLWGPVALSLVTTSLYGFMMEFVLIAIPLFTFMAYILEGSGISENLFDMMYKWAGPLKGGLAVGTVAICAIVAAMSGMSATGTLTMGIVALPAMLNRKYDKNIAIGCIAAGGALGILIPPSIPMVVYGLLASVSVGRLFLGGILPGFLLTAMYIAYIFIRSYSSPHLCPALPKEERASWSEKFKSLRMVILPAILIVAVLGSIFLGIATPTEAAAVGALGSVLCSAVNRKLTWGQVKTAADMTLKLTAMIMWIIAAASAFTSVYNGLGSSQLIQHLIVSSGVDPWIVIIGMQITIFFLGMILDPGAIMMITIPVYAPVIVSLGFDPLWFGILFIMNMECAYITPPFGWNLFYLKSIAPKGITLADVWRSVVAFVGIQLVGLAIVMIFPQIALILPNLVMGK
jgi:tripartite ATP-independent transporter DctM subunit